MENQIEEATVRFLRLRVMRSGNGQQMETAMYTAWANILLGENQKLIKRLYSKSPHSLLQ